MVSMVLNSGSSRSCDGAMQKSGNELAPLHLGEDWLAETWLSRPMEPHCCWPAVKIPGAEHISFWDWKSAKELSRAPPYPGSISNVGFLADGSVFIAEYKEIVLLNRKTQKRIGAMQNARRGSRGEGSYHRVDLMAIQTYEGSQNFANCRPASWCGTLDTKELYPSRWAFSAGWRKRSAGRQPEELFVGCGDAL
jgi:hypothetical protein